MEKFVNYIFGNIEMLINNNQTINEIHLENKFVDISKIMLNTSEGYFDICGDISLKK